jgi:hypothetical protein
MVLPYQLQPLPRERLISWVISHYKQTSRHVFTFLLLAIHLTICYYCSDMTAYTIPHPQTLCSDVAARKAARRKVIERAQRLERDSYKAMMQRRRQLQASSRLATMT